ncbi:MAG: ACP S-malonyltransferase [Deltaproteobacteria bacterium]|nr:ACP S-malonyltransferase [Deltaproteobacteria bacterium]
MSIVGLVFPGQGSQYVGMGWELYQNFKAVRDIFSECDEVLHQDISRLCFEGPGEELDMTENTQVAVLTVDVAIYGIFNNETGITPSVMAGHSLGEYSALTAAGAIAFADALPLVKARGRYHQEAVPKGEGSMAAIVGLGREKVEEICREISGGGAIVEVANINGSEQFVISGHTKSVNEAISKAKEAKAKLAVSLPISVPCHCSLLRGAAERLGGDLDYIKIEDCGVKVIPNVDPELLHNRENTKELLKRQIISPVRWKETIEKMVYMGVDTIVELGPKKVLSGLIKRIDKNVKILNIEDMASFEKTVLSLN